MSTRSRQSIYSGRIMGAIYRAVLDEIERAGFPVLDQRISLTPIRKLWIAWRTWVGGPAKTGARR